MVKPLFVGYHTICNIQLVHNLIYIIFQNNCQRYNSGSYSSSNMHVWNVNSPSFPRVKAIPMLFTLKWYIVKHVCMHICIYMYAYACMYVCMYVCVCVYVHCKNEWVILSLISLPPETI